MFQPLVVIFRPLKLKIENRIATPITVGQIGISIFVITKCISIKILKNGLTN
jgi:hypothetical protein